MANQIHEPRNNEGRNKDGRNATEAAPAQQVERDSQKADATADLKGRHDGGFYEEIRIEIVREDETAAP